MCERARRLARPIASRRSPRAGRHRWTRSCSMPCAALSGVQLTVTHLVRVDERLLIVLWQLAERRGRGSHGVRLPLAVTHDTLGRLVGARPPSVTATLITRQRAGPDPDTARSRPGA